MEIETRGLGAGSYPEPKEVGTRTVRLVISFKTEVEVPENLENYCDIKEYIEDTMKIKDLLENYEEYLIDDIEK